MDDLIKEPDRLEFVDSDHIMNYLQNMDEACENSLMGCEESMGEGVSFDKDLAKLNMTEGLLDNLIKSVCGGINDSTLINKDSTAGMSTLSDNESSDMDIITKSLSLDAFENTQLNEVNETGKLTKETFHADNSSPKQSLGASESCSVNIAKKTDSEPVCKNESVQKSLQPSSKEDDNDVIVLDEKEFSELIKMEKQGSETDDCEIIEEKKPTLSCDAKTIKTEKLDKKTNVEKEASDHAFHINDNMKQGLSKLTFPSKASFSRSSVQKKKIPPLRPITNTRITIGQVLEKAQDVQNNVLVKARVDDSKDVQGENIGIDKPSNPLADNVNLCLRQMSPGSVSTSSSEKSIEDKSNTAISSPSQNSSPTLIDDQDEMLKAKNKLQEKTKVKSKAAGRLKLVNKMSELLKFTFDHEHFPSSVNMARLAKIVGVTWSQIRNWFTNRRVENKRNGIFPRDKVLDYCPYCLVTLKTEAEQKGHLFAAQHIRKILGTEYAGDDHVDAARWKNPSSDRSGKVSPLNPETVDVNSSSRPPGEEANMESNANKLGKRWKDSFLAIKNNKCNKVNILANQSTDSEKKLLGEVKEEYEMDSVSKASESVVIKSECEDNFQDVINKMEGINSKHLSLCSSVTDKDTFSGAILNKYVSSSQKGKFAYSKVIGQTYKKGFQIKKHIKTLKHELSEHRNNKSPSVESNQSSGKSFRIRQKNSLAFMEDSLLGYQCPTCFKIFQTEWQMIKHTMTHLMFICNICEKSFFSEHDLKLHLLDHLTGAYEEEKYYCQFSCKICHSLKCECYDPQTHVHKEIPKAFERPQKAKRSKPTFRTKPYCGMNDHLRVTFGNYHKYMQKSNRSISEIQSKLKLDKAALSNIPRKPAHGDINKIESKQAVSDEENGEKCKELNIDKTDQTPVSSVQPKFFVRKDLVIEDYSTITEPESACTNVTSIHACSTLSSVPDQKNVTKVEEKPIEEPQKKGRGRPAGRKSTVKDVCIDADFYYMCEICDSSFFSKAELQEHMFFHRLKSRSRRGSKRSLEKDEDSSKKAKLDECAVSKEESESFNFEGFKRYKCRKCKGHFANVTDLNRHRAQVHNNDLSVDSLEVLKCNYCEKTYRRERELCRHLKHACPNAPKHLKTALTVGTTLQTLQDRGDGPHYTMVNKSIGSLLKSDVSPSLAKGPYKCRYCHVVTKYEKEMKDHIWKDCTSTPNIIKKRSQQGLSLEELGFHCQEDEVEDMIMSGVAAAMETDVEEEATLTEITDTSSAVESGFSPPLNKSKDPLVCAYCGIWYYRKVSLVKHMKERCILIPAKDRKLLNQGSDLCDAVNHNGKSFCEISNSSGDTKLDSSSRGLYKKVQGSDYEERCTDSDLDTDSNKNPNATNIPIVSNEDLKNVNTLQKVILGNNNNSGTCSNESEATSSKLEPVQNKRNTKQKGTRCNRCHETFVSPDAVLAHSSVHHGPKKGLYKCKLCQDRFQKYKQLREHVWLHTQETPYKCHLCDARYRVSDNILEHLISIHGYQKAHERNIFKWLPCRNGKYRTMDTPKGDSNRFESEETLEGLDTNLENLAEDMVVTDDMCTGNNEDRIATSKGNLTKTSNIPEKAKAMNISDMGKLDAEDKCKDSRGKLDAKDKCKDSKESNDLGGSDISPEDDDKKSDLKSTCKGDPKQLGNQTEQESSQTAQSIRQIVKKPDTESPTKASLDKGDKEQVGTSSKDDDDGELFSGLSNLDSIIETVNLTDDSLSILE
ncbi:uncharacterized protein LOC135210920 [Macrobrachium nipponense]|uniref:uncharacterized protein LOC135210920 n=1 Tax=Macrobrachium nipponense TaxID=159736 RepID=UPI0030C7AD8A